MRTIHRRNGMRISLDAWNLIDGTNYPPGSLKVGAHGITAVELEDYPDAELFNWSENLDGTLNVTPIPQSVLDARLNERIWLQVDAIERTALMPRTLREVLLTQPDAEVRPWYAKVKSLDDEIKTLKAGLK